MASESVAALRETAEEGARRAGRVLAERFERERTVEYKGGIDLVTDADKASEAVLLAFLGERYPHHAVLAEESGLTQGRDGGGLRWVVDPLDGTTNYAHRLPHFSVSVAVEGAEGLLAGVVYDPLRDELFSAGRGLGATLNGRPLKPSACARLSEALLCTGFPYDVREKPALPLGLLGRFVTRARGMRRLGSAALDLCYVAAGRYDGYFEFGLKPWDIAAGALIAMEAGARVCHLDGAPMTLARGDVLASAPRLAPELEAECRAFLAELGWRP